MEQANENSFDKSTKPLAGKSLIQCKYPSISSNLYRLAYLVNRLHPAITVEALNEDGSQIIDTEIGLLKQVSKRLY